MCYKRSLQDSINQERAFPHSGHLHVIIASEWCSDYTGGTSTCQAIHTQTPGMHTRTTHYVTGVYYRRDLIFKIKANSLSCLERGFIRRCPDLWRDLGDASLIKAFILTTRSRSIHLLRLIEHTPFSVCIAAPRSRLDGWNMLCGSAF